MRKILFCLTLAMTTISVLNAQTPAETLKKASKAYKSYDPTNPKDRAKLPEIKAAVEDALKIPENQTFEGYLLKAKMNDELAASDVAAKQELTVLKKANEFQVKYYGAAFEAYTAGRKALSMAVKNSEKKDAAEVLNTTQGLLNQGASDYYDKKDYANAYNSFNATLENHEILLANKLKSSLDDKALYKTQLLYVAAAGTQAQKGAELIPVYQKMIELKCDTGWIYEGLYTATVDKTPDVAVKYLTDGMKRFPDDSHLLITLINYKLKTGKLDELISDLKLAIEKEPKNASLYVTLGNVLDQLSTQLKTSDPAKSAAYETEALSYFHKTLEMDAKNSNAIYSIGASYYNKAAELTKELKVLDADNTKEGIKKYEAKNAELLAMFEQALPYFKKVETLDPNDRNTLIALKEIFAREDKLDLSIEFKKRLEVLDNNGKNTSYFLGK